MAIFKKCSCGHPYSEKEFSKLPFCGFQDVEDPYEKLELRNCPKCKSPIGVWVPLNKEINHDHS